MSESEQLVQGTDEWLKARLGKVTASRMADMTARIKTGYGASRGNYMAELIVERLTGASVQRYTSPEMVWGTQTEPQARDAYCFHRDADVEEVGFVPHPRIDMAGASPDGYVGLRGLVEIKCPLTATHIETLLGQAVPERYRKQVQFQLACTGRDWCDWVSFDPRLPHEMQLFVQRIERDEAMVADLEEETVRFLAELDEKVARLQALYGVRDAA